jgi:hypothetical protein
VSAGIGPTKPVPNVGDLSLVAALVAPDTAEARAPMPSIPPRADDDLDIPSDVGSSAPPSEVPEVAPEPAPAPARDAMPGVPTTPPAKKQSPSKLLLLLVVLGLLSAGVGGLAGRLRTLANRATKQPESAERPPGGPATQVVAAKPAVPPSLPSVAAPSPSGATDDLVVEPATPAASIALEPPPAASAEPTATAATPASASALAGVPPGDLNSCVLRMTPEGAVQPGRDFGFLCKEKEFWSTARRFDLEVAKRGRGPGMVLWAQLGRFDLAAISYVWHRCCPSDAKPFVVATPKGVCDGLNEAVHDVGKDPSPEKVDAYSAAVECLFTRQVHHPSEWWDRVGPKDARAAYDQFRELVVKAR